MHTHIVFPAFDRSEHVAMIDSLEHRHAAELAAAASNAMAWKATAKPTAIARWLSAQVAPNYPTALGWAFLVIGIAYQVVR